MAVAVRPTFLWDAANSRQLPPHIAFTRASAGWCHNKFGILVPKAANEPRIDFDPVTLACRGLLVEEGRTNLVRNSEDFAAGTWTVLTGITRTYGIDDPFGGTGAVTLTAGVPSSVFGDPAVGVLGTTYTTSMWMRRRTGTGGIAIYAGDNTGLSATTELAAALGKWVRISRTGTPTTGSNARCYVAITNAGDAIDIFQPQIEVGSFSTSYIPTYGAAVTRAAELPLISGDAFASILAAGKGTIVARGKSLNAALSSSVHHSLAAISDGGTANRINVRLRNTPVGAGVYVFDTNVQQFARYNAAVNLDQRTQIAFGFGGTLGHESYVNGLLPTAGPGISASGLTPAYDRLAIGVSAGAGATEVLNGWIEQIAVYSERLSNADLQALSAQ